MRVRRFIPGHRPQRYRQVPGTGNAMDEGRVQAGMGELPESKMLERSIRPPILTPRGNPTDDPFTQMPVMPRVPATRLFNPQSVSTYRVDLAAGVATSIFAATRERSYALIVNGGANVAVITYGRVPSGAADGIPLAALGVGFHELLYGTTSTMAALSAAGTFLIVTEGRFDPPMES